MPDHRSFSERTYYVPFGRYQPGGEVSPPDTDKLIGRDGHRKYFVDLLLRMGRRGAFLVTGHRGIGKTSFVKHCLSVHEKEVCERFLNNNVGRAFFWDQVGVLILGFIALLALEMASQLLDLLTLPWAEGRLLGPLAWILLIPLVVICLYPLLFAWEVFHTIGETRTRAREKEKDDPSVTRAELLLRCKAALCILLTLHLLSPLLPRLASGIKLPVRLSPWGTELIWIGCFFVAFLLLFLLEYQGIVHPSLRKVLDRDRHWSLARLTMPWILFKAWLPVLTVPVNLGFEKLDHRRVIHAMLAGLREQYKRAFLSWSSGFANLLRLAGAVVLLVLVHFLGARWFELPRDTTAADTVLEIADPKAKTPPRRVFYGDVCSAFKTAQTDPSAANLICKLPGGDTFLKILYFNLLHSDVQPADGDHLLFQLALPYRTRGWPQHDAQTPPFLRKGVHFDVYHVLLLGLLYLAGRWLLRRFAVLPYEEIVRRIDEVMDFLSARTSVTSRTNRWEPVQVFQGWLIDERTRQIDQDPADPRTVEFLFLQILNDIQLTSVRLGGRRHQLISLPSPEVTFLFDELDKLGTRIDPGEKETGGGAQQAEILHAERRRSLELHRLLADMKNLLSSAPARFIFVGGRNLHDEWLADQGSRQPLLTNIFNAEVYLPSLLTDLGWRDKADRRLDLNVDFYLRQQIDRAKVTFKKAEERKSRFFLRLPIEEEKIETFVSAEKHKRQTMIAEDALKLCTADDLEATPKLHTFNRDFRQFLTYRSMGNPKRLKELLGAFVRPRDRVVMSLPKPDCEPEPCEHVLAFGDTDRFRIQLVARIYRHLAQSFEHRLVNRDDKLAVSLFYLADFLFKFHRRAFSWGNLERVDELVHIHRAPDLREILEALVGQWTERFLHPIRNGMYDFRFRSDLTREVEYISRQSPDEMAAFNFTLDESQALKSAYSTNIAYLTDKTGRAPIDMVAGLGELHEFDQEYEDARVYYWRAVKLLDERIAEIAGELVFAESRGPEDSADSSAVLASFVASERGKRLIRHFLTWGVSRLRLMLQIGMTFELTRNFERASIEYRNANTLATAIRTALLEDPAAIPSSPPARGADSAMHPLKHLNILFQPVFAEAWIAEKLASAVDTGIGLVEKELWALRHQLPFVNRLQVGPALSPVDVKASNFSLIMAEMHNKAGDLYFYKGRQRVTLAGLINMAKGTMEGHEGYLLRAHYHYAVALQEMRRLISYRRESSKHKMGAALKDGTSAWKSLQTENWPDFLYRAVGGALNDLAEATLGRVSLFGLLCNLPSERGAGFDTESVWRSRGSLVRALVNWMESPSDSDREGFSFDIPCPARQQALQDWLGWWTEDPQVEPGSPYFSLITFERAAHQDDFTRLIAALQLKMAGSKMLEKGGYIEVAAHELLGVCEIVTHYLWWLLILDKLLTWVDEARFIGSDNAFLQALEDPDGPLCVIAVPGLRARPSCLISIALYSLEKASRLFKLGRKAEDDETVHRYFIGNQIPVAQLLLTCSLGLALSHWDHCKNNLPKPIPELLQDWGLGPNGTVSQEQLRKILKEALVRHSYPMVNRLQGLKVLIDDSLLEEKPEPEFLSWIFELIGLTGELDAPLHFTPLHSGVTYALAYCRCQLVKWESDPNQQNTSEKLKKIRSAAQRDLETSEEMFTLRRAYYENISDLSYLYDDFNDRQLHLSHGIQMAGAEVNALFKYLVTIESRSEFASRPVQLTLPLQKGGT